MYKDFWVLLCYTSCPLHGACHADPYLLMQCEVGCRYDLLTTILLVPICAVRQRQAAPAMGRFVAVVQGRLECVVAAEALFCFTCLLLMQNSCPVVFIQLAQWACLQGQDDV